MGTKQKILVLQGVPASGKSTYARELVSKDHSFVIVSRDEIRAARGIYWLPDQEDYISDIEEFEIKSAIKHGLNPVIDATNLNPKTISKWENLSKELNVNIEFKKFEIDFKTALERDSNRERSVGRKTLETFFFKYFPDKLKEYNTDPRLKVSFPEIDIEKNDCIIVDLDGTVCLHNGRNPYDLARVSEDLPNEPLVEFINDYNYNHKVLFLSGREGTKQCYNDSYNWLVKYFGNSDDKCGWELMMRKEKDFRGDEIVKEEIYNNNIKPHFNVLAVFDDRDKVVKMWRDNGLLCNQVYWGNF